MNHEQNARRSIQFSLEKKTLEKEKWIHHLSTIKIPPVDGLYYKKLIHQCHEDFLIYLKMFIMQWKKSNRAEI